ncbi:MAG: peptidoglycan-associated lipoprotein [SAR116 cluster bacterium]|nr:peptidoglycan-associated lipoprotein [SAR116 cluster bacterium]
MKRFILLAASAALLAACETASEIDAIASGASGSSASTSASSGTSSSSGGETSSTSSTSSSSSTSSDSGTSSYSYDTDPKTALIKVGDRVLFGYDSSELDDEDRSILDNQGKFLNQNPSLKVTIEGHCDERGTREYNLALGEKRASAVKDYLISVGINGDRISVVSYGKERPQVLGSNKAAWSMNRRSVTSID